MLPSLTCQCRRPASERANAIPLGRHPQLWWLCPSIPRLPRHLAPMPPRGRARAAAPPGRGRGRGRRLPAVAAPGNDGLPAAPNEAAAPAAGELAGAALPAGPRPRGLVGDTLNAQLIADMRATLDTIHANPAFEGIRLAAPSKIGEGLSMQDWPAPQSMHARNRFDGPFKGKSQPG